MTWHRLFPAGLVLLLFAVGCGQPAGYMRRPDARSSDATMEDGFDPESDGSVSEDTGSPPDGTTPPDAASCDAPRAVCAGSCVDVRTDSNNCGGCGVRCGASQSCMGSRCMDGCPAPNLMCGASCVNAQTDRNHCGFCGNVCNASQNCVSGACMSTCPAPNLLCGSTCTSVQTDRANCGFCGNVCTASQNCVSGSCTEICPAPTRYCGGVCVDVRTDRGNCGSCGNVCTGTQTCSSGVCTGGGGGCFVSAPQVLFYGPAGTLERTYLPSSALVTVATEAMWRSFTTADFRRYKLIVIGDLNNGGPTSPALQALYDTRSIWGAAVDGRVVVQTIDAGYHAMPMDGGTARPAAQTLLRAELNWLTQGPGTALYVSAGGANTRDFDYLAPLGGFSTVTSAGDLVTVTAAGSTHPAMAGSSGLSLSNWMSTYHAYILTFPTGFTALAAVPALPFAMLAVARDVACP